MGGNARRTSWWRRLLGSNPPLPTTTLPNSDPLATLTALERHIAGKVPAAVSARVTRIAVTIRDTVPRLDQLGLGSQQAHSVLRTATTYLPEAIGAYLRLPRRYADQRPIRGGKTSLMVLCDQLDLLASKMDEVFVAVCASDADALVAHGRFLTEKFGHGSLSLDRDLGPGS